MNAPAHPHEKVVRHSSASPLRIAGLTIALLAAAFGFARDASPALAAFPDSPKIRVQQLEPLCLTPLPGQSCPLPPTTFIGAPVSMTSIIDFDYGSPLGQPAIYSPVDWTENSAAANVVTGNVHGRVDLFCDGQPDVLAAPESADPEHNLVRPYPLAAKSTTLESWLTERLPPTSIYPVTNRSSAELSSVFLGGTNLFETTQPLPFNYVTQNVPWGQVRVSTPVLGGRGDPPGFPPLCMQSQQQSTASLPGQVATMVVNAGALAAPKNTLVVSLAASHVGANFRMFAGTGDCPAREGDRIQAGDPQRWAVTWPTDCIQSSEKVQVTFWADILPTAVSAVEIGSTRSTLAHELGHALCLTHPPGWSPENLMNEQSSAGEQLLTKQINTARLCAGQLRVNLGLTGSPDCAVSCSIPLTFPEVGTLGQAAWDSTRITNSLNEANEIWTPFGITFTWNTTLFTGTDPSASPGGDGDILCPSASKGELDALSSQTGKAQSFRVFLINSFVDSNGQNACGLLGYTKWAGNVPGGVGQYVVIANSASKTADGTAGTVQTALTSPKLRSNPFAGGLYPRWTVTGATAFWANNPAKTDKRSPGLDISINLRCYEIGTPGILDSDNDCLDDSFDPSTGNVDSDGDGLFDSIELWWNSSPSDPDSDNDSLSDAIELYLMTNPLSSNTDGDTTGGGSPIYDPIDNCPLHSNADQADADLDAWVGRWLRLSTSIIGPANASSATSPKTTPATTYLSSQPVDAVPLGTVTDTQPFLIQNKSANGGGDACDNDDDRDAMPDAVECSNASGDCAKSNAPNAVSVIKLTEPAELYPPNGTPPLGIFCVNADVDHDGVQEASATALAQKLGIPVSQVVEHVIEVRQNRADSDGDGWLDGFECSAGSNPDDFFSKPELKGDGADNDLDGVTDEPNGAAQFGGGDEEGDRLTNVLELAYFTACVRVGVGGQLPHSALTHCNVARADVDGDTLPDVENDADGDGITGAADVDSDGDTIGDAIEAGSRGTMAHQADSDGDGCRDGLELGQPAGPNRPNNPINSLDFHDVGGDNIVAVGDIGAVVGVFGSGVGLGNYPGVRLDKSGSPPTPDGTISVGDIGAVVVEFGLSCI